MELLTNLVVDELSLVTDLLIGFLWLLAPLLCLPFCLSFLFEPGWLPVDGEDDNNLLESTGIVSGPSEGYCVVVEVNNMGDIVDVAPSCR